MFAKLLMSLEVVLPVMHSIDSKLAGLKIKLYESSSDIGFIIAFSLRNI